VPNGSTVGVTAQIEDQVERRNANLVGGDINGGVGDLRQTFLRPTRELYKTPLEGLYLCSSSTPPGGGVHGMCGYHAARAALKSLDKARRLQR
jgi:phytoene dehydrogenase-like protein